MGKWIRVEEIVHDQWRTSFGRESELRRRQGRHQQQKQQQPQQKQQQQPQQKPEHCQWQTSKQRKKRRRVAGGSCDQGEVSGDRKEEGVVEPGNKQENTHVRSFRPLHHEEVLIVLANKTLEVIHHISVRRDATIHTL